MWSPTALILLNFAPWSPTVEFLMEKYFFQIIYDSMQFSMLILNKVSILPNNRSMVMQIAKNVWFLLKNYQKPLHMRVMLEIFRIKAELFFEVFFNHFEDKKKLYNIYQIQRGSPKNDWVTVDILKKSTHFSLEKMTSYIQYFINNYRSVYIKMIFK